MQNEIATIRDHLTALERAKSSHEVLRLCVAIWEALRRILAASA